MHARGSASLEEIMDAVIAFRDARNWKSFHSPKNLSMAIAIEASELMEIFQWVRDDQEMSSLLESQSQAIRDEVADILIYTLTLASDLGIDPLAAMGKKLEKNALKYPPDENPPDRPWKGKK